MASGGFKRLLALVIVTIVALADNVAEEEDSPHVDGMPRIAIVGAGVGGAAAADFMRKLFGDDAHISVFESGVVGGRVADASFCFAWKYRQKCFQYEAGGSIIHPRNSLARDIVRELGLKEQTTPKYSGRYNVDRFSLHRIEEVLFVQSEWSIVAFVQLLARYGAWTLYSFKNFLASVLDNFANVYTFLSSGNSVISVEEFLSVVSGADNSAVKDANISLEVKLYTLSMPENFVKELATAAVRTNYGQMPQNVHAFVGAVALAGAEDDLWSVKGGNKQIAERLLQRSKARLVSAHVSSITLAPGRMFEVTFTEVNKPILLHKEGANKGRPLTIPTDSTARKASDTFDIVIIATPLTTDKSAISINGLSVKPKFDGRYHRTVATLVEGEINPSAFGFSYSNMTAANFFLSQLNSVISVNLLVPTEFDEEDLKWLPRVWKIFSTRPLHDSEIDEMFLSRRVTQTFDWLAYPHYSSVQLQSLGNFTLHPGLYHINGIEWAASAIEMSLIGAKNVANLAHEYWAGRKRMLAEAVSDVAAEVDKSDMLAEAVSDVAAEVDKSEMLAEAVSDVAAEVDKSEMLAEAVSDVAAEVDKSEMLAEAVSDVAAEVAKSDMLAEAVSDVAAEVAKSEL